MSYLSDLGKRILAAKPDISNAGTALKNELLEEIAASLRLSKKEIIKANQLDIANAEKNGITGVMIDRLALDENRIDAIAASVRKVAALSDPVGEVLSGKTLPNGLKIQKVRVPLGVVGMIYEARPNVTVDAAVLCLKSSNAVLLKGGKEAIHTNRVLAQCMRGSIQKVGLNADIVCLIEDTSRETTAEMMRLNGVLDVLIPRGGAGLIRSVVENATVPVIETGAGNCHVYVDEFANLDMAAEIVYNAKTSRPSVCNACESLLVHRKVAEEFLPLIKKRLDEKSVEIRGCLETVRILGEEILPATEEDYADEFLGYIISVKLVSGVDEAIAHINRYSTGHSESIVTDHFENAMKFTQQVDSAAVYVNASTRFTDGEEFGLGAEIGIATQKLHARGPMGLSELTSSKYVIFGNGQIR